MKNSYDEKTSTILQMIEEGKTREEIAEYYGNSTWKSVDMYMRRRGFSWENERYVEEQVIELTSVQQDVVSTLTQAAQIVRMLDVKHPNPRQVAQKQGFESVDEMGKYMKSQSYIWNDEHVNYVYNDQQDTSTNASSSTSSNLSSGHALNKGEGLNNQHLSLLNALLENQDELLLWLQYAKEGQVPHYKFKGSATSKTLTMTSSSIVLLNDFSKEFNVSQRIIIEAALAEYLKKYGYANQVHQATM